MQVTILTALLVSLVVASAAVALAARRGTSAARAGGGEDLRAVMTGQERERRRWARELHADTLPGLAALRALIGSAERSADPARYRRVLDEAATELDEQVNILRQLITELRPPPLDVLGLRGALEALLARTEATHDLIVDLTVSPAPDADVRGASVAEAVYRIVQEASSNAARHARARRLQVSVVGYADAVFVAVEDDGVGFDPAMTDAGFGLAGMRERALAFGGTLLVGSGPGRGTRISARIPKVLHDTAPSAWPPATTATPIGRHSGEAPRHLREEGRTRRTGRHRARSDEDPRFVDVPALTRRS